MSLKKFSHKFKRHLSDSTATVIFFTPLSATLETMVARMSDIVSIKSRLFSAALTYGGLAYISRVRDYSRKLFGVKKKSKEIIKYLHDSAFAVACTAIMKPFIYSISGETDWEKIAIGTLSCMGLDALLGGPFNHFIDVYRELTGVEESKRLPDLIEKQRPSIKTSLAVILLAVSLTATGLIYSLTPNKNQNIYQEHQKPAIEQILKKEDTKIYKEGLKTIITSGITPETNQKKSLKIQKLEIF